jgi:hypothetical protein
VDAAAEQLRAIKEIVAGKRVEIHADTHLITLTGPAAVVDKLIELDLAQLDDYDEDECEDVE